MDMLSSTSNLTNHQEMCHDIIVDLENFRVREGLTESTTLQWIKKIMGVENVVEKTQP